MSRMPQPEQTRQCSYLVSEDALGKAGDHTGFADLTIADNNDLEFR